ncbi:MAG: SAM hydrolase/SAM-dependent halogenase family protein, partial [Tepidisphaeraceae bacterium]
MRQRSNRTARGRPIITLTSDFGLRDSYVAAMKAVLIGHCPDARLIDVTHQVPPRDVLCGSITLERAVDGFPKGTVHLAVVDPGVGTNRRLIIAQINGQLIVCPDNGLVTWSWRLHPGARALEITWRPARASNTFHGRDILAPVAGMLAAGRRVLTVARTIGNPVMLDLAPAQPTRNAGRIIQIDHFGNATTNIPYERLGDNSRVEVQLRGRNIGRLN